MSSEAATSATLRKHLGCPNANLARASTLRALGIVTLTSPFASCQHFETRFVVQYQVEKC